MCIPLHLAIYALALTRCSAADVDPVPPPPRHIAQVSEARREAIREAHADLATAKTRLDAARDALASAEAQAGRDEEALARVEADQRRILPIAALPAGYSLVAQVTGFERGAVFAFGMAIPEEGSPEGEVATLRGTVVLVDPQAGDLVALRSQLVANSVYFRGRIRCVNGFGAHVGCNAYSHATPKATGQQTAARKRLAALQAQREALKERLAPLADARREVKEATQAHRHAERSLEKEQQRAARE